jgi:hypothetical protein
LESLDEVLSTLQANTFLFILEVIVEIGTRKKGLFIRTRL